MLQNNLSVWQRFLGITSSMMISMQSEGVFWGFSRTGAPLTDNLD